MNRIRTRTEAILLCLLAVLIGGWIRDGAARATSSDCAAGTWDVQAVPSPGSFRNVLTSVDALSRTDIWAVGSWAGADSHNRTLAVHWDGASWSQVPTVDVPGALHDHLQGIA